jgi:hypothetical protein
MNNLIVTILAIGIAAAASLSGAYYGGNAFMAGQSKADASRIVTYMNTVAGAINLWSQRNGGTMPATSTASLATIMSTMGTRYLPNEIATLPDSRLDSALMFFKAGGNYQPVLALRFNNGVNVKSEQICLAIESLRAGTTVTNLRVHDLDFGTVEQTYLSRAMCGDFGCYRSLTPAYFGLPGTYTYIVYKRLAGKPYSLDPTDYLGPSCPAP